MRAKFHRAESRNRNDGLDTNRYGRFAAVSMRHGPIP